MARKPEGHKTARRNRKGGMLDDASATPLQRIGQRIAQLRLSQNLRVQDVAERLGIAASTQSHREFGDRSFPVEDLFTYADAFGVGAGELLEARPAPVQQAIEPKPATGVWDWTKAYFAVGERARFQTRRWARFTEDCYPVTIEGYEHLESGRIAYVAKLDVAVKRGRERVRRLTVNLEDLIGAHKAIEGTTLLSSQGCEGT